MRRFSRLFVFCALLLGAPFAKGASLEADLQGLLSRFTSAWDKSDAAGIAVLFEGNADLVIPDGLMVEGREAIQEFYASVFHRGYRGSRGTAHIRHVRPIGSDMVLVDGVWRIDGAVIDGQREAPEVGIFNLVAKHRGQTWAICSLREQTSARDVLRQNDPPSAQEASQPESGSSESAGDAIDRSRIQELDQKGHRRLEKE
ncbi:MAG TPA: SgcJ/EcaC family oxidoreductase [Candidatus Acidoferrum sp.]|nr:SgcJ/EcaC family oxidoreductase [Candidatus Acidoferrum sp.]